MLLAPIEVPVFEVSIITKFYFSLLFPTISYFFLP